MRLALMLVTVAVFCANSAAAKPLPGPMRQAHQAMKQHQPVQALALLRQMATSTSGRHLLKQKRLARKFSGLTRAAFAQSRSQALRARKVELYYFLSDVESATGPLAKTAAPKTMSEPLWRIISNSDKVSAALERGGRISPSGFVDSPFLLKAIASEALALSRHLQPSQLAQANQLLRLGAEQEATVKMLNAIKAKHLPQH